ncbi:uncharacterized membrane protein HdeD (DUF308 family) [Sulfitobacter undariae]|uniref:Uncharacterized membrane protein HdeD (DUF308 family) n=1 Tax=Sulfitobacter undariae TaxID=1563671 RepID=A0A7W6H0D8_9RHOB|nr:DUF308 domain-containing protein [Sulfitobacter undariae]MBB3994831.1 uncharacterized membrane protein HdeD (DUF308 family) [Sulfitobacter undariae]
MKNWFLWLIVGVVSLLGGLFALANPFAATLTAVVLAGWMFMIVGILTLFLAFGDQGWGGRILALVIGLLLIIMGGNLVGEPLQGMISLTYFVGLMMLVTGGFRLLLGMGSAIPQLRLAMIVSGAISIILGAMIFANFPQSAVVVLGVFLAIELISNGVSLIVLALSRKNETVA